MVRRRHARPLATRDRGARKEVLGASDDGRGSPWAMGRAEDGRLGVLGSRGLLMCAALIMSSGASPGRESP